MSLLLTDSTEDMHSGQCKRQRPVSLALGLTCKTYLLLALLYLKILFIGY
mgnify:CR=1 FL=1